MNNPYLATSFKWYEFELNKIYPDKTVKQSRGYTFKVGNLLINCKDNEPKNWAVLKTI